MMAAAGYCGALVLTCVVLLLPEAQASPNSVKASRAALLAADLPVGVGLAVCADAGVHMPDVRSMAARQPVHDR
jgi:hypothetical protein